MGRAFTVWFYIGVLLSIYGVLLTAAGAYQVLHPPATTLAAYHATLWVGGLLLVIGLGYMISYWPRSKKREIQHDGAEIDGEA